MKGHLYSNNQHNPQDQCHYQSINKNYQHLINYIAFKSLHHNPGVYASTSFQTIEDHIIHLQSSNFNLTTEV